MLSSLWCVLGSGEVKFESNVSCKNPMNQTHCVPHLGFPICFHQLHLMTHFCIQSNIELTPPTVSFHRTLQDRIRTEGKKVACQHGQRYWFPGQNILVWDTEGHGMPLHERQKCHAAHSMLPYRAVCLWCYPPFSGTKNTKMKRV